MALWTVELDVPRDTGDSRRLWILQTKGLHVRSDSLVSSGVFMESSFASDPACCSSTGFTSSLKTHKPFSTNDVKRGYSQGGGSRVPPLHFSPPRERLLGGLAVKLFSLFGWGWWDLLRAAGLLVFLEMGDLFWDTSTDKNNGMQDSHTDPLINSFSSFFQ